MEPVWTCKLCRFQVSLDDTIVAWASGWCLCLGCYLRETGTVLPMPAALRRAVAEAMALA